MKEGVELRRIQVTGGATYIISMPKKWARQVDLKPGDQVAVIPQPDMSLLVVPEGGLKPEETSEAVIQVTSSASQGEAVRDFIAYYLAGYDIIRLHLRESNPGLRSFVKNAIRQKLIGVEIVEESSNEIATQCLYAHSDLPLKKALSRMSVLASSMHKDAVSALLENNRAVAEEVIQRDDEVDRFYHFIVRQLKQAVSNRSMIEEIGLTSARDCLGYRIVVKSVERTADHAASISRALLTLQDPLSHETLNQVSKMSDIANEVYEEAMKALMKRDAKLAHEAISRKEEVYKLDQEVSSQIIAPSIEATAVVPLKLILESLKRIADYGADIAEIALNLTVTTPFSVTGTEESS